ncbi:MAG: lipoate--protein ligase family protein [Planctomycetes bacterium]|nr:lipoate--protein ligase family protein [Planctomycetota bacterium]
MQLVDHTCATPEENLALDEALLDEAEASDEPHEVLRLWESNRPLVVVGRSTQVAVEVNSAACDARGVPVLRRSSGGGAVVAGPGCLMYGVVLSCRRRPELRSIDACHRTVMEATHAALAPHLSEIAFRGTCDLAWREQKFSGNSLRCRRDNVLYHGTLLYDFPLELIAELLGKPQREPEYRLRRSHAEFVTNLPLGRDVLRQTLIRAWQADEPRTELPLARMRQLVAEKYSDPAWNARH